MKKTQLFENRNILKRVLSWMLLFSMLISTVPVQAATGTDLTYMDLLNGLSSVADYSLVAETIHQKSHSESSIAADLLDKTGGQSSQPIMTSYRGFNAARNFALLANVEILGGHDVLNDIELGVFEKSGGTYTRVTSIDTVKTTVAATSSTFSVEFDIEGDISFNGKTFYVMQVDENGGYIQNGKINPQALIVQYGESVDAEPTGSSGLRSMNYVGSLSIEDNDNNPLTLMQNTADYDSKGIIHDIEFGSNIHTYYKDGNKYELLDDTSAYKGNLLADNDASCVYIRDNTWPDGKYRKFNGVQYVYDTTTDTGSYKFKGYSETTDLNLTFSDNTSKIASILAGDLTTFSKALANSDCGLGGLINNTTGAPKSVAEGGNGTVSGPVTSDGRIVTVLGTNVVTDPYQQNQPPKVNIEALTGINQNYKLPIADNEYFVINVDCTGYSSVQTSNMILLVKEGTETVEANPGDWKGDNGADKAARTGNFSRVIWNYVMVDPNNPAQYIPYDGTIIYHGNEGGMLLAPAAKFETGNSAVDAASVYAKEATLQQEVHQRLFDKAVTTKLLMYSTDDIKFTKKSEDDSKIDPNLTSSPLEGAKFLIYTVENGKTTEIDEVESNSNGEVSYTGLRSRGAEGSYIQYYIQEIEAPEGYVLNTTAYPFTLEGGEGTIVLDFFENDGVFYNAREKGYVQVKKTDKANGQELSGAEFGVYNDPSCTGTEITTLITDGTGFATSGGLPVGKYWIKETQAPAGYTIDDTSGREISITANHTTSSPLELSFTDTEQSTCIQFYAKKNFDGFTDNNELFNFELTTTDTEARLPDGTGNKVAVKAGQTGCFGGITFTYTDLGGEESTTFTYVVKEIVPTEKLPGVKYDTTEHTVTVTLEYKNGELTVSAEPGTLMNPVIITNKLNEGYIQVKKTDEKNSTVLLEGAVFKVYKDASNALGAEVTTLVTGEEGTAITKALPVGNYWIKEITAPEGYELTTTNNPVKVTVTADHTVTAPLTQIFTDKAKETAIELYAKKNLVGKTDNNYTFGFELSPVTTEAPMPDADGDVIVVRAGKTEAFGGITFTYADLGGEESTTFTYVIKEIVPETRVPGMKYDTTEYTVTVTLTYIKDSHELTVSTDPATLENPVVITNRLGEGYIKVKKTDGTDSSILLEGAVFTVYSNASCTGPEITTLTTDSTGFAISGKLPEGDYWVKETTAPEGYAVDQTEPVHVKVEDKDSPDEVAALEFTDTAATANFKLYAAKKLLNKTDNTHTFEFELSTTTIGARMPDGDGNIIAVKAGETGEFGGITYTYADLKGAESTVFTYVIRENEPAVKLAGVTYDTNEYTVNVTVRYTGTELTITADVGTLANPLTIVNTYEAKGSVTFGGRKSIDYRDLMAGDEFSFSVKENGEEVATGKAGPITDTEASTTITFTTIEYTLDDVGTHEYSVTEYLSTVPDVNASILTYNVKLKVSDNGDGTLKVEMLDGSDDYQNLNFVNHRILTVVKARKSWVGGSASHTDISSSLKLYSKEGTILTEVTDPGFKADEKLEIYTSKDVPLYKPGTSTTIDYVITEVKPEGYEVIYANQAGQYTPAGGLLINSAYPKFQLNKTAMEDHTHGLQDCTYGLFNDPECTDLKMDLKTDANGNKVVDSLEYGVYYLKEKIAPTNYAVSDDTYAVVYTAHADGTEIFGIYEDSTCTTLLSTSPASTIETDENGTAQIELDVGSAKDVTVYVVRESDKAAVAAGTKTPNKVTLPSDVLVQNNGKLFIHLNKSNVHDYKLIDVSFGLEKSVVGNDPAAATFEFSLTAEDGVPCSEKSTVTISYPTKTQDYFGKIVYGKPGVYEYKVKETVGNAPGYTYDGKEHTLVVTVEDDGNGVLVPKATYDGKALELTKGTSLSGCDLYSNLTGIEFVNQFSLIAKTQMKASKTLTGRELSGGEFSFTLKSKAGTGTPGYEETVTNGKEGSVTFSEIVYDGATHKGKTYTYELAEVQTNMPGYTLDDTAYEIVVKLSDDMQTVTQTFYELSGSTRTPVDSIKFVNAYEATASVTFEGAKAMTGRELTKGDEFSFTVTEDGYPVATGHSDETGVITFTTINYYLNNEKSDIGEHTYIVTEDDTNRLGVTKDGRELTVKVTVTDNGDGTLKTELSYGAELSRVKFVNAYEASGCVTFTGAKELTGRELTDSDEFSFTVKEGTTTVATGKSDKNGVIKFTEIRYYLNNEKSDIGEHTYIVTEDDTTIPLITKDGRELTVKVMVVDEGNGKLRADILSGGNELTFINQYDASGKITLTGSKALTGRELTTGDEFSFTVKENGEVRATGKNDLTGKITFSEIVYHLEDAGTHVYTVTEDAFTKLGVTGDNAELTVTVFVTNNKASGTMEAKIVKAESDELAFQNAYEASGCITFTGAKILTGRELTKGDEFTFTVTENGKTVAYGTNNETSVITFTEIRYVLNAEKSDIGEHTYIVTEDDTNLPGITKDGSELTVKVMVTDNGDGTLKAEIISGGDEITFTNMYRATGTVDPKAVKYVDRVGAVPGTDEKFDFYLEKEDGSRITVQNNENGVADFGLLEYTEKDIGETFVYTMREKQMVNGAFVTDPTVYIMTVDVEDNGDGTLNPVAILERVSADGTRTDVKDDEEIVFLNERKTSIHITKEWEGGEEDEIVLILYANGKQVPETEIVTDPETGKPTDKINYVLDREGYRYTFSQLAPTDAEGNPITYAVKEKGVSGYMRIYQNVGEYRNKSDYIYDGGTVINRAVTSIRVKKVWEGIDDESKRPDITLTLYCNGTVYNKKPSGPNKDGWYSWNNLPIVFGGRDAVYYVVEEPVEGFKTTYTNTGMHSDVTDRAYNGGTITNNGVPATGDSTPVWFLSGLLGMSILGVILILRKKKTNK